MNEQTDLQMMIPSSDNIATIRHVLGLAKFHRWIRTFNDSWVENDMPSTINFSAEISAYFAVSFPRNENDPIKLGCQGSEADWLNLISISAIAIDLKCNRFYLIVSGYTLLHHQIDPIAIGIHLNTAWKALQFEKHSKVDFYSVQIADGVVQSAHSTPFKEGVSILMDKPEQLFKEVKLSLAKAEFTVSDTIQELF